MSTLPKYEKLQTVIDAAQEIKAVDITVLHLANLTSFTDYFVLCTGTSDRHASAVADNIVKELKKIKQAPLGIEGEKKGTWVLIDADDIVIHVLQADERAYYHIEDIWKDAARWDIA